MLDIKYIWRLEVSKGYPDEVPVCFQLCVSKEVSVCFSEGQDKGTLSFI